MLPHISVGTLLVKWHMLWRIHSAWPVIFLSEKIKLKLESTLSSFCPWKKLFPLQLLHMKYDLPFVYFTGKIWDLPVRWRSRLTFWTALRFEACYRNLWSNRSLVSQVRSPNTLGQTGILVELKCTISKEKHPSVCLRNGISYCRNQLAQHPVHSAGVWAGQTIARPLERPVSPFLPQEFQYAFGSSAKIQTYFRLILLMGLLILSLNLKLFKHQLHLADCHRISS